MKEARISEAASKMADCVYCSYSTKESRRDCNLCRRLEESCSSGDFSLQSRRDWGYWDKKLWWSLPWVSHKRRRKAVLSAIFPACWTRRANNHRKDSSYVWRAYWSSGSCARPSLDFWSVTAGEKCYLDHGTQKPIKKRKKPWKKPCNVAWGDTPRERGRWWATSDFSGARWGSFWPNYPTQTMLGTNRYATLYTVSDHSSSSFCFYCCCAGVWWDDITRFTYGKYWDDEYLSRACITSVFEILSHHASWWSKLASLEGFAHSREHSSSLSTTLQPQRVNPVEHIWDDLREKYFVNRVFSSLDTLQELLCVALNTVSSDTDAIRSMTYFPHIRVACEKAI